ncbi:MAG: hypothetical protein M3P95_01420, partial [Actinomycetota bacterium]|nr:hypothetical protein [Actinomycetota bacterium]
MRLGAVGLDRQPAGRPGEIDPGDENTGAVVHGVLQLLCDDPCVEQHEPQPCLERRLGARVGEVPP